MEKMMARVVIHTDEDGLISAYMDEGVEVIWVDERTPQDRCFRAAPRPIPEGMVDDLVGFSGDGSAAETRAFRAEAMIEGRPHLNAVDDDA